MTQSTQMIEELDDCFLRTAANIAKYYGKISTRLGITLGDLSNCSYIILHLSRVKVHNNMH